MTWAVGAVTVLGGVLLPATAASAAEDVITVTSLGLSGPGTLRGALEAANASTNPDGVRIVFDAALAGTGELSLTGGSANSMLTTDMTPPGSTWDTLGARFLIDSEVPVSIDFTNLDGITDIDGSFAAGIYVASDDVSLSNLANLRAAESGIVISGTGTTVTNVELKDNETNWQEVGVLLLDGAADTTLTDLVIQSPLYGGIIVEHDATVTNTVIDGLASRGVETYAHVFIDNDSTVTGFTVRNSVLGNPAETSPTHGVWLDQNATVTGLTVADSTIQSPGKNGLFFDGAGQTLTDTSITGTTFGGNEGKNISRTIGNNTADWNGLVFSGNDVSYAGSVVFGGTLTDATFADNSFTNISDGVFAALQLGDTTTNVDVTGNTFDVIWAVDTIRVQGAGATDVVIADNTIENLTADISRSAIRIDAPGTGNIVQNNTLIQDLTDETLPATVDNHWAIYNSANAASADAPVGWSIIGNSIDGFGGRDRSQAPIVHNAIGTLPVIGNTFGANTRGGTDPVIEESGFWFLWNVGDSVSNNTVQTFRPETVRYDGATATFTAVQPANLIGNNTAAAPVTLHVYWTAADNAEEYLGEITGVAPGASVSIPTTHTTGFLRVQTVDANGFTSQYSSIDEDTAVVPAAPAVTGTTPTGATGTGTSGATITVRNTKGDVVATAVVGENGAWSLTSGLTCNTQYFVDQTVDGVESATIPFTTAACPTTPGTGGGTTGGAGGKGSTGGSLANTGGADLTGVALGAMAVLLLGGSMLVRARRRRA
ncbi:hypothetical protein CQ047_04785 [Microbacterium sp. MYb72]|uniref:hypothetical protein n=1 Tax=Microbacterium sp. MYb72 TaxID=1848693 RepID=UPI000CFC4086|nr:hypothetical protein [Microbacterium sp. MYb72]PRB11164.1 hypothetical protein CQ047_04785 [Microbacterium sp. MYb72]